MHGNPTYQRVGDSTEIKASKTEKENEVYKWYFEPRITLGLQRDGHCRAMSRGSVIRSLPCHTDRS